MDMKIESLSVREVEAVAFVLAKKLMSWDEPIPEFGSRFPNILESCLAVPFSTFARKNLYHGLEEKAGILFYLLIKNHPFQNGNKRIATATLLYFLMKNRRWLETDHHELYRFVKWVAESNPKLQKETVLAVGKFIKTYLVKL
ncbi:MAG: hypothetical protein A2418_01075 [Candidatus Brennerbacteria bacterium RIFOXYC1_FULL_41_11]|nr:MAG: hypothetical protein A2418_01075 [Candidatus Brennerbacteria bacterium RIFOXYC1_FULL_41_11]